MLNECILPIESAFISCPSITVTDPQAHRLRNGGALSLQRLREPVNGLTRVYSPNGDFLGLGLPVGEELKVDYLA